MRLGKIIFAVVMVVILSACGGGGSSDSAKTEDGNSNTGGGGTTVTDKTAPVITILGDNPATVVQNSTYKDAGATAKDSVDGVVSVKSSGSVNTSKVGTYIITYTATDKAGNKATAKRTVKVIKKTVIADTTPPVITIKGDNPTTVVQNATYTDAGATATDTIDGTVTVKVSGSVDTSTLGEYTITYTATDKAGNEANATRTVTVKPADVVWNVSNVTEFRQALEDAAANGENDTIILSAGVYSTTSDNLGTFAFDDNEAFSLTIKSAEGLTHKDVILDGNNTHQVFNFNNTASATLIFKGISVLDGNTSSNGGGIYGNQNMEIKDCNISNNTTSNDGRGGGFYSNGTTTVTNSTISNNSADDSGGGFYSYGITTVTNSTISNNSANNNYYSSSYGGGFYSTSTTTVTNSTISNNSTDDNGGGFYSDDTTKVTNSTISNNSANYSGGGFYSSNTTIVVNSIFLNNSANSGDSFYASEYRTSHVSNNNFIGNRGSIYAKGVFINNIFDSNNVDITLTGDSKVYNNYIDYSKIEDKGNNVIKKKNLQPASVGDIYLSDDNTTLTDDSPVIDKGLNPSSATFKELINDDGVYNTMVELLKTDKVGNKRVHNGTIDMGAIEYGSSK